MSHACRDQNSDILARTALLHSSGGLATDLFHWTDVNGVMNFTNDFSTIPESVRLASNFTVRKDFFSSAGSDHTRDIHTNVPSEWELRRFFDH